MENLKHELETKSSENLEAIRLQIIPYLKTDSNSFYFWYELLQIVDRELDKRIITED